MNRALIFSLAVCAVSVALEGLFAGGGIKKRFAELRIPRHVPPLWAWVVIGAFYYLLCFVLLYRLFSISDTNPLRRWTLTLLFTMMFINALWNCFFFRTRNLFHAWLIGFPYAVIALLLFVFLLRFDRTAAFCLLPYLVYLFYAGIFGYRIWKLNPHGGV